MKKKSTRNVTRKLKKAKGNKTNYSKSASLVVRDVENKINQELQIKKIKEELHELNDLFKQFAKNQSPSKLIRLKERVNSKTKKLELELKKVQKLLKNTTSRLKSNSLKLDKFI